MYRLFPPLPSVLNAIVSSVVAGTDATHTQIDDVTGEVIGVLMYKVGAGLTLPSLGDSAIGYTLLTLDTDILCATGDKIIVAEVFMDKIYGADIDTVVVGA